MERPGTSAAAPVVRRAASLEQSPDEELVGLCAGGDEIAWAVLVRRYRRLVFAVPHRAGLDQDRAEEVFQATFAKLAEKIGTLREPGRVRAWVVTTARRLTIDAIRARRERREEADGEEALAAIPDGALLPSEEMERLEAQHLVRLALGRLAAPCRRLLTALFSGREHPPSYESIAAELDIPVGSIGPTRARCLQKLLKEFRDEEAR